MAIDVGPGATNRATNKAALSTMLTLTNPTNETGCITSVELWFESNATGVIVGTFYGSGLQWTPRAAVAVGSVTSGAKRTIVVSLPTRPGDILGVYYATGTIDAATSNGGGVLVLAGDQTASGEQTYVLSDGHEVSIYATGASSLAVDGGSEALDRANYFVGGGTYIDLTNPTNLPAILTSVQLWCNTAVVAAKLATFSKNGTTFTPGAKVAALGDIAAGSVQTVSVWLSAALAAYVGLHWDSGYVDRSATGGLGVWYKSGDNTGEAAGSYAEYTTMAMSVYVSGFWPQIAKLGALSPGDVLKKCGIPIANVHAACGIHMAE